MNLNYTSLLPEDFNGRSRVWIYQASRLLTMGEALDTETMLEEFTSKWQTHGAPVKGFAALLFGQFVIIMADETATGVSGCSTDSSVRVIKEMEQRFGLNMFDRTTLAFVIKDKVQLLPLSQLQYAFDNGFITADTLYFNNLVQTKTALESQWLIPVKNSWLQQRLKSTAAVKQP
jgi:hypothetical protein